MRPEPTLAPAPSSDFTQLDFTELFGSNAFHGYDADREQAKMDEGKELDGGGRLGDVVTLIKACLQLDIAKRPSFEDVLACRYLSGKDGWVELEDIRKRAVF